MSRQRTTDRHVGLLLLVLVLLSLTGCARDDLPFRASPTPFLSPSEAATEEAPSPTIPPTAPNAIPKFEATDCPFDAARTPGYAVDCGFVVVPQLHRDPTGPTIRLAVARFRSQASAPAVDPVVYLMGGPGGPALISTFTANIAYNFTPTRDFIAFDQRGVGHSDPALTCPELTDQTRQELMQDEGATDELAHEVAARFRCRDRLQSAGIDLTAYNTTESAADVNDIRVALGYGKVDLFGASYGTRLALTVMRDFPHIIRSVVLDSASPPSIDQVVEIAGNANRALNLALQGCVATKACAEDVPTLQADFNRDVTDLNAHPLHWPEAVLTGDRFSAQIVALLGSQGLIGAVPALIEAVKRGDDASVFDALAMYTNIGTNGNSTGMSTSVVCNDDVPFNSRDDTIAAAQRALPGIRASQFPLALSYFDLCAGWPRNPPDARNHQAVTSDLPALILESADDPATPPANGQLAARTLSRSYYVETPGVGHTVMGTQCGRTMIASFVAEPTREPDTGCMTGMTISYTKAA